MATSGSAARRYAEALLSLAPDDPTVKQFRASLEQLAGAFDRSTIAGLRDPAVPIQRRRDALTSALKDEPAAVRSLLVLLLERDRVALVPQIAGALADIVDQREGIAKARITTAVELSDQERADLVGQLERTSRRKLRATFALDRGLIGGARVQIGDHLIDESLSAKLSELGRVLAS